jgi:hypothetical protein
MRAPAGMQGASAVQQSGVSSTVRAPCAASSEDETMTSSGSSSCTPRSLAYWIISRAGYSHLPSTCTKGRRAGNAAGAYGIPAACRAGRRGEEELQARPACAARQHSTAHAAAEQEQPGQPSRPADLRLAHADALRCQERERHAPAHLQGGRGGVEGASASAALKPTSRRCRAGARLDRRAALRWRWPLRLTATMSALSSMDHSTPILSATLAPPITTHRGRLGWSMALPAGGPGVKV